MGCRIKRLVSQEYRPLRRCMRPTVRYRREATCRRRSVEGSRLRLRSWSRSISAFIRSFQAGTSAADWELVIASHLASPTLCREKNLISVKFDLLGPLLARTGSQLEIFPFRRIICPRTIAGSMLLSAWAKAVINNAGAWSTRCQKCASIDSRRNRSLLCKASKMLHAARESPQDIMSWRPDGSQHWVNTAIRQQRNSVRVIRNSLGGGTGCMPFVHVNVAIRFPMWAYYSAEATCTLTVQPRVESSHSFQA